MEDKAGALRVGNFGSIQTERLGRSKRTGRLTDRVTRGQQRRHEMNSSNESHENNKNFSDSSRRRLLLSSASLEGPSL